MTGQPEGQGSGVLYKLGAKIFLANSDGMDFGIFVRIFNRWIREQAIDGHLLIDVHDYRHVHEGPGVLLVGHQGNFSLDFAQGRPGLVYYRKQPLASDLSSNLRGVLKTLLGACLLLQDGDSGIEFATEQFILFVNDRLLAPSTEQERVAFRRAASGLLGALAGKSPQAHIEDGDPRDRFALALEFEGRPLESLLQNLAG